MRCSLTVLSKEERMQLNRFMIRPYVEQALREEIGPGDTTGGFLVGEDPVQTGQIYAKGNGVVCGMLLADETIKTVDPEAQVEHVTEDGDDMEPGKILIEDKGEGFHILHDRALRARLDPADVGHRDQDPTLRRILVKHTNVRVTDTRKGWPGLRMLQKYAVRVGGAHNHIFSLHNCVLVKDNHIKIAGSIRNAVEILRAHAQHTFKFEVECETLEMVQEALDCGVEVIMFDNMDIDEIRAGLKLVNKRRRSPKLPAASTRRPSCRSPRPASM